MAKFQASSTWDPRDNPFESIKPQALSTWDPWDKPSEKVEAQDELSHFLHPYFSRSENEALSMTKRIELFSVKEFAIAALGKQW